MNKEIEALVKRELEEANKIHPQFNSTHEGYAVILEETEELAEESEEIEKIIRTWWAYLRKDEDIDIQKRRVEKIRIHAVNAVKEAIQVIAMCDKFKNL
jgi:hypothetical protein